VAVDEMRLHFDAPPQVRAGLNMTRTALLATVYYAVKCIVDPSVLPNAGLARPLTVTAREGTVVSCSYPAAVNGRCSTCQRVVDLVFGALAEAVPERVIAAANGANTVTHFAGQREDGSHWVYLETIGGGSGARPNKDGLHGVQVHMTNTSNLPVEAFENEYPLTLLRYELVDGSGGAGRFRGGMGLRRVYRADAECRLRVDGARLRTAPWGLAGGGPGAMGSFDFGGAVADHGAVFLQKGQVVEVVTAGGGGYGPASLRDTNLVTRDLAEGR
jgi:N-methylhydantoinase B